MSDRPDNDPFKTAGSLLFNRGIYNEAALYLEKAWMKTISTC